MEQDPTDPTGVRETSATLQPETTRARRRKAWAAWEAYVESHDWEAVAASFGYPDGQAAQRAAELALEQEAKENPKSLALMRRYASQRLERMLRAVWKDTIDETSETQLASMDRAVRVTDRWIKLHGLDAPSEVVVHSPTTDQIEAFVSRVVNHGRPMLTEGDIFSDDADDSEVIDMEEDEEGLFNAVANQ